MKSVICILIFTISCYGCKPMQEKILGTYDLDPDRGCSNCVDQGPELMTFEDWDINDGTPGYYHFHYANGENHSGTYDFMQMDTMMKLILYPDSTSFQYYGILGSTLQTEYKVSGNKIKENCDGVFRNCLWLKREP